MKLIAAGLTALAVYIASGLLLDHLVQPLLVQAGWQFLEPPADMRWWRAGAATAVAVFIYSLVVRRRRNAILRWRKELAARARA